MISILEALNQQKPKNDDLRPINGKGLLAVSLSVFEAQLHRMGLNPAEFDDVQPEDREYLLSYYETNINKKMQ